jgi:hypothetical protein
MDARGVEDAANSNTDGQVGKVAQYGVQGMQEQNEQVEGINIGTLKVPLSPIGNNFLIKFWLKKIWLLSIYCMFKLSH